MLRSLILAAALLTSVQAAMAQAPKTWTQVGMLSCKLNPSIGFVIFGHQSMECRFVQNPPFPVQLYEGALNTVGIDLGISAGGVLGWAVLAPTAGPPPGALAGEYVGATGEVAWVWEPELTFWSGALEGALPFNQFRSKDQSP
jgi:hypothetical protein